MVFTNCVWGNTTSRYMANYIWIDLLISCTYHVNELREMLFVHSWRCTRYTKYHVSIYYTVHYRIILCILYVLYKIHTYTCLHNVCLNVLLSILMSLQWLLTAEGQKREVATIRNETKQRRGEEWRFVVLRNVHLQV